MADTPTHSLENALARSELDANTSLKAAQAVVLALKKYRNALSVGNLKDLEGAMNEIEEAEATLRQQIATGKAGWGFDVDSYLNNGDFVREILSTAAQKGVRIFERDDRLYSYPVLVRLVPSERGVRIDKVREKKLRPTLRRYRRSRLVSSRKRSSQHYTRLIRRQCN
jgi:hypothetical protein